MLVLYILILRFLCTFLSETSVGQLEMGNVEMG